MIRVDHFAEPIRFPASEAPSWSALVDRWNQLDAYAFALPELYSRVRDRLTSKPSLIFLASPESSNRTDFVFAQTGASSPAKFVHTLPNSRGGALMQTMQWSGPIYCLQDDPNTVVGALAEAALFTDSATGSEAWIFTVQRHDDKSYTSHLFTVGGSGSAPFELVPTSEKRVPRAADNDLFSWLQNPGKSDETVILNGLLLKKTGSKLG